MSTPEWKQVHNQRRLYSFLLPKTPPPVPLEEERKLYPHKDANIVSRIFFWWINPILKIGYIRTLQQEDLFVLTDEIKVEHMDAELTRHVERLQQKHSGKISPTKLYLLGLFHTFRSELFGAFFLLAFAYACSSLNPFLSRHLISYVESKSLGTENSPGKGCGFAIGTSIMVLFSGMCQNHSFQKSMVVGAKVRSVLIKQVTRKAFLLSEKSNHKYPASKIVSMVGADMSRIELAMGFLNTLVAFPVAFIISLVILIVNIGVSALVGIALLLVYLGVLMSSTTFMVKYRRVANRYTDKRVGYIQEVLSNLRMIKFYTWEIPYFKRISEARGLEMKNTFKVQALRNTVIAGALSFSNIVSMVSFLVLYAIRGVDNISGIFSSLSLFNVLASQVYVLPVVMSSTADAYLGLKRLSEYLSTEEKTDSDPYLSIEYSSNSDQENESKEKKYAIQMKDCEFQWENFDSDDVQFTKPKNSHKSFLRRNKHRKTDLSTKEKTPVENNFSGLHDINLTISDGEFWVITGPIGSGKTTLLSAMAELLKPKLGSVEVARKYVFCAQPWIQNATVEENIVFGSEFDAEKYDRVTEACCLKDDFNNLAAGDQTEIGERGINLSGGQKARVNLARAVYCDSEIILMDDVLSAVDARVGKKIVDQCILGLLGDRTRILATHQLSLINDADKIIFINEDGRIDQGSLEELKKKNKDFEDLIQLSQTLDDESDEEDKEQEAYENTRENKQDVTDGKLMREEYRAVNGVPFNVYKNFVKLGSGKLGTIGWLIVYLTVSILAIFVQLFANVWLTYWVDQEFKGRSNGFYIGLYVMFSILTVFFIASELLLLIDLNNKAALNLHLAGLKKVLHTPMSFIDSTPLGRIMNRFSRDTEIVDNEMSNQLRLSTYIFSMICGTVILCIVYLPWFAIAVPFLMFIFFSITSFYQASSREIKRLDSTQRSFVYTSVSEILNGKLTIELYKSEHRFLKRLDYAINRMNEANYLSLTNQRWLAVHVSLVAAVFCLIISFLCVFKVFSINASSVGLLLSYVLQIAQQLNVFMRSVTQLENQMNSVERLNEYATSLEQEPPYNIDSTRPDPEWPRNGGIKFDHVSMAYREGLPLVLNDLNFEIKPKEKIGVCGRTGAGKSSIMTTLFRVVELSKGSIYVDDIDISTLGLQELRSKISIIPQDPVLFKDTIRGNLDPFGFSDDSAMWDALKKVHLVSQSDENSPSSKFNLDRNVEEDGANFSLGEKQLLSFARSLVTKSKILILDEATSSVDYDTDSKIQNTVSSAFRDCTILAIAHRLKTILDYDRILVLDSGRVVEFDTPWTLYSNPNGVFRDMCEKAKIGPSSFSRK